MTKLSAKLASIALASAMALSLFAVLPAHAAENDTPPAETPTTTETTTTNPTAPDPITDDELEAHLKKVITGGFEFQQADGTYRIGDPVPGGTATGSVPEGAEKYYSQKLSFDTFFEPYDAVGGYMIVPIDYSNPNAGNIALFVVKYPAKGERKGSIVFNPGGPGGSSTEYVLGSMEPYNHGVKLQPTKEFAKLNENYDLIGLDPRGVGHSLPVSQCTVDTQSDPTSSAKPYSTDAEKGTEDNINGTKKYVNSCFEYTGKIFGFDKDKRDLFLRNVGTTNAVRDMDVLRSLLGEEKLNFIGLSYGTRLGYVYAQNFPKNVGKFTLDGAMNPFEGTAPTKADETPNLSDEKLRELNAHYLSQGKEFQATYEKFAQWCYALKGSTKTWNELSNGSVQSNDVATCPLLLEDVQPHEGDLADDSANLATQQIQNILRPLAANPLHETKGTFYQWQASLGFGVAVTAVRGGMYSQTLWPRVAYGLLQTHAGKVDEDFAKLYNRYNSLDLDKNSAKNTIECADSANPGAASVANGIRVEEMYYELAPFTDPGAQYHKVGGISVCSAWPFAGTLAAGTPVENLPNVLVVSTRNDPATAYENGEVLAKALFGTELTVEGAQHVAFGKTQPGYECANDIILNHMINGTIPADGQYPPICSVASFRAAAEVPDVPVTPPTDPTNKPEIKPEVGPDVKPGNQPSAENADKKDEKQVKTAGKTATKAVKAGSRKLAQTGVNVTVVSVVMFMVLAAGAVLVRVRRH